MTELEALNTLLRLVGLRAVNDYDSTLPAAENARATLTRISGLAQAPGWWFNTDWNVEYQPDGSGFINIPAEIRSLNTGNQAIVRRGTRLYNSVDHTYVFTENVTLVKEIRVLDWDLLPESMQTYITYRAGAEFIRDELEDSVKEEAANVSAGQALIEVKAQHLESMRFNNFHHPRVLRARGGVRPHGRSRVRFTGTPDA